MSNKDIILAWKDEDYLDSLSEEQRVLLPENPVGVVELSDREMEVMAGGRHHRSRNRNRNRGLVGPINIDIDINFIFNINNNGDGVLNFTLNFDNGDCNFF